MWGRAFFLHAFLQSNPSSEGIKHLPIMRYWLVIFKVWRMRFFQKKSLVFFLIKNINEKNLHTGLKEQKVYWKSKGLIWKFHDSPSLTFSCLISLPLNSFHMLINIQLCGPTAWNFSSQKTHEDGRRVERKGLRKREEKNRQYGGDTQQKSQTAGKKQKLATKTPRSQRRHLNFSKIILGGKANLSYQEIISRLLFLWSNERR